MKIAVLITCHNRKCKTIKCIQNLFLQSFLSQNVIEVYLTNDGCTDGTVEEVLLHFPSVNIVGGDGTLFWNRGMLAAWKKAAEKNYDAYLWLNDDTELYEDCLFRLLTASKYYNNKSIIIGSTCSSKNKSEITYGGYRLKENKLITNVSSNVECDFFNGNIVLIPKYVFKRVGMNDAIFHHAIGDFDYGLRARKKNIKSFVVEGTCGICDRNIGLKSWCNPDFPLKQRYKSFFSPLGVNPNEYFIYKKRHYGLFKATLIYILNYIHLLFPSLWIKKTRK